MLKAAFCVTTILALLVTAYAHASETGGNEQAQLSEQEFMSCEAWFVRAVEGIEQARLGITGSSLTAAAARRQKQAWYNHMREIDNSLGKRYKITTDEGQLIWGISIETGAVSSIYDQWLRGNRDVAIEQCSIARQNLRSELDRFPSATMIRIFGKLFGSELDLSDERPRVWTDQSGAFSTDAMLSAVKESSVSLRKTSSGKQVSVSLDKLSRSDLVYLSRLVRESVARPSNSSEVAQKN